MKSTKFKIEQLIESAQKATALEMSLGDGETDVVEKGFHPTQWWSGIWGLAGSSTRERLRFHVASGRMEVKTFRITKGNRAQSIPHYRAVK